MVLNGLVMIWNIKNPWLFHDLQRLVRHRGLTISRNRNYIYKAFLVCDVFTVIVSLYHLVLYSHLRQIHLRIFTNVLWIRNFNFIFLILSARFFLFEYRQAINLCFRRFFCIYFQISKITLVWNFFGESGCGGG